MTEPDSEKIVTPERARARELMEAGNRLRAERRFNEALACYFEAVRADGTCAAALHNLGVLLTQIGRPAEGELAARKALSIEPGRAMVIHALAHSLMMQGKYKEGWALYEVRGSMPELNTGFPSEFPFPRWKGEPLAGKRLAVFPEQGLGDQVQFSRFLPGLIDQAGALTLLTAAPLKRLFEHNFPGAEIVVACGDVEFPDPDYWITLHDLPGVLGIELDTIPLAPYLRPPGTWPALGPGFKIGLKTRGNPKFANDAYRSLPKALAAKLRAQLPGIVVSLEPEESGAKDMAETAAIIEQLDLIVSVDTSVAHLAGAMGKPCLVLIPGYAPDWRWMPDRTDSAWYPQHKLFRGDINGEWEAATDRLIAEAQSRTQTPVPKNGAALAGMMQRALRLRDEARFSEALDLMRQTMRTAPENPAPLNILGMMLSNVGRHAEAEKFHRSALAREARYPAFRYELAITLLAQGRYEEAWPLYEARSEVSSLKIAFPRGLEAPRWRGEDIAGKSLAILPEQGLGDAIQFVRFLPWLQGRGAKTRLYTPASLVDLFRASFPEIDILAAEGRVRLGRPDFWTTLIDMAAPLGVTLENLPPPPYLRADRVFERKDGFAIGLQTKGSAQHTNDAWRSLSAQNADDLRARLPGRIVDLDPQSSGARNFADSAALIQQLDLIVSVDTSVAHLAGALGKPCLLLVPSLATDWRWLRGRNDSPWYPAHRLFWGEMDGSWGGAIEAVVAEAERRHAAAR